MVDYENITLTSLRIIFNFIRDAFGKQDILPEEAVHNLVTLYMEAEYGTYEYDNKKCMEREHNNFWYRQAEFILTSRALSLTYDCSCYFLQHHQKLSLPLLVHFLYICGPLPTLNVSDT